MKVGLAIETDAPGGAETMLLQLAAELQLRGHEVVAFGPTGGSGWLTGRFAEMGIERVLVEFGGAYGLGGVPRLSSSIRKHRLDVLHSHEFFMSVCGALATRMVACRHVITMHGGRYHDSTLRRRLALRLASSLSRHVVAVSEAFRGSLALSLSVDPGSVEVVHNGVAAIDGGSGSVREELGVRASDALVLAVGNLLPVKGHSVLLEAIARLPASHRGVVLAIAGTGPEEARLSSLATRLGISDRVHLLGYRADIPDLLAGADVFAMPSVSEGLPMAVIEAMLAGTPIVASDVGGVPELIPEPAYGSLVPSGDPDALAAALDRLLGDAGMRERLGTAAQARALRHFTASAMADRYLSLYAD